MKIIPHVLFILTFLVLSGSIVAVAQPDAALLRDLAEENKKSVEALVLYPSETRLAILEATKHPEALIKMQDMREKTTAAFRTLIEDFPRTTQAVFYDLSRYPGLIESLVDQRNNATAQRQSLEALPDDKRDEAFGVATRQMATLEKINDLNQTTHRTFERLIAGYPAPTQEAFRQLLDLPEVIELLNEDLRFTVLVGETYRDNPAWVIHKMDSLNLAVARSHAEELDDWKKDIENDPDAKSELQAASHEYATDNGYADDDYRSDDLYDQGGNVYVENYYNPYPYWYGYPWWEPVPRWHPYPWWWDWGCQFPPHGVIIVYLPSYHFMHWYFDHPRHHEHYNHLSTHFVNHYNGHRRSGTTISEGVREWRDGNRGVISDDFLGDKKRLPERLKEYGRFEQSRQDFNARNPKKAETPEVFLDKNAQKFPDLKQSREVAKTEIQRDNEATRAKRSDWAPAKAPAKPEPAPAPKTVRPPRQETIPNQKPAPREPAPAQRPRTQPDEAKDYHRQKWEETKPAQPTRPSSPAPAAKPAPTPRQAPANKPSPNPAKTPTSKREKSGN